MSQSEASKQAAVAWILEQMDRHGLTFDDLVEAGCFAAGVEGEEGDEALAEEAVPAQASAAPAAENGRARVLYRNAMGQTWDGTGEYPDWLQRAVNAGQSIDFYRVD